MRNSIVNNLFTILLLLIYVNRGFFVSSVIEIDNPDGEINSVLELFVEFVTGEGNDIDEDGDQQNDQNYVQIVQHDFSQQVAQFLELANLSSININKLAFLTKEELPIQEFFFKVEQPPEMI
jgi:hypothetical protein